MRFLWSTLGSSRTSRRCWNGWSRYYLIDMFASPSTIFSKVDQEPEQRRRRRHHRGDERGAAGDHGGQHDHVTGAPLLYILYQELSSPIFPSWVSQSASQSGIGNTCPDLQFVQYIRAWMSSTDPISSITNCYRLIVSYTDPVHSFTIS